MLDTEQIGALEVGTQTVIFFINFYSCHINKIICLIEATGRLYLGCGQISHFELLEKQNFILSDTFCSALKVTSLKIFLLEYFFTFARVFHLARKWNK